MEFGYAALHCRTAYAVAYTDDARMRGVEHKRQAWREAADKDAFLNSHVIPVVAGPDHQFFAIDYHHTARALLDEGVEQAKAAIVADLAELPERTFWNFLDQRAWCRPYNAHGERCEIQDIPTSLSGLQDDPFRSLVADIHKRGGFAKNETPYSEFLWADSIASAWRLSCCRPSLTRR